jgi:bacillithiol biosynthesis cysteine-adding enzyme BshC
MSRAKPVRSQCIPFSQIPHSSRQFLDFLSSTPQAAQFYPRSAVFSEWFQDEASRISYPADRRKQVADILDHQTRAWGASARTLENIQRLRSGALAVVTGQQVGLFGGPLFSILKALTATRLASMATAAGVDTVPIFWLATEDHDLAEINHVGLLSANGQLERVATPTSGIADAPVGTIRFENEITGIVNRASELLGESEVADVLRNSYRPGETFGSSFARLFTQLLGEWGLIVLDPSDSEFHRIAQPLLSSAAERAAEIDEALLARGKALEAAGYEPQVKVTPSSTLLFTVQDGARTVIHRRNGDFSAGAEKITAADLRRRLSEYPERFNANVLLRPVMQDYLLPTLAYTGGAAEIAYWAQVAVVYEKLVGRITPIIPRFSATVVGTKGQGFLDKYRLSFQDILSGPESLRERMAATTMSPELRRSFDKTGSQLTDSLVGIRNFLERLDPTLIDAAKRAEAKMQYQLGKLHSRAVRAEVRKNEVFSRHADWLSTNLYPGKVLQEREVGGISFLAAYGKDYLAALLEAYRPECLDHQLIFL